MLRNRAPRTLALTMALRTPFRRCVDLPQAAHYVLLDASVPLACLEGAELAESLDGGVDSVARVDIEVRCGAAAPRLPHPRHAHHTLQISLPCRDGTIASIRPGATGDAAAAVPSRAAACDLKGCMVWPTFVDLHTHIGGASCQLWTLCIASAGQPSELRHGCRQEPHVRAVAQPHRLALRRGPQHRRRRRLLELGGRVQVSAAMRLSSHVCRCMHASAVWR